MSDFTENKIENEELYTAEIIPHTFKLGWECTVEGDGIHCCYTGLNGLSREECFIPRDVFVEAIRQYTNLQVIVHSDGS